MRNKLIGFLVALIVLLGGSYGVNKLGSVNDGQAYNATSTTSAISGTHQVLKSSGGVLGSVTIASTSAFTLEIWNATSTTDSASTSIAKFKASPVEGTYMFDASLPRGIIIAPATSFNGNYTITWK
jgi:hypothetical protein